MVRLNNVSGLDITAESAAREQWNSIAKPLNSLGLLESAVIKLAGIYGTADVHIDRRCAVVMCADNGVVCENVTQTGSEVTSIVAEAIAEGTSNINLIADTYNCHTYAVDIGMNSQPENPGIIRCKVANGTENIAEGAAMTTAQAERAISAGIDIVEQMKQKGYDIIISGEMGIGNTTTSSAVASVLLDEPVEAVTGKGAGLDNEGLKRKIAVIKRAVEVNKPDKNAPVELLAKLGGFDIAGMTGLFLGGAIYRLPVVIDGFISAAAAALAVKICPVAKDFMLCSHVSKEPAGKKLLEQLKMKPLITAELCLGEGTGGAMLLPLLDGALSVYHSVHRFENLPMERYVEL